MRAVALVAVVTACVLLAAASVADAQPKPARAVRPAKAATGVKPGAAAEVSPASGSKSNAVAAQCNRQALLLVRNDMAQVLAASCVKRRKQSRAYCGSLAERKIAALRRAVVLKCEAKHPKGKALIELMQRHSAQSTKRKAQVAARVAGDEDPRLHPTGFIGRIADYLVQKASGTTGAEVAAGCDFQRKMNCRAWITDCADSCMGETMASCQSCMGGRFTDCCQCDIVRQFGVQSCNY